MAMKKVKFVLCACSIMFSLAFVAACCRTDAECDDGNFCNGFEYCNSETGRCETTIYPCLVGGRFCDEANDRCVDCLKDTDCSDDGLFCNGEESCDEAKGECVHSGNPCPLGLCDEEADNCGPAIALLIADPVTFTFLHIIGVTNLPQLIGTLNISSSEGEMLYEDSQFQQDGELAWVIVSDVPWLSFSSKSGTTPSEVTVRFNGNINPVAQDLEDSFTVKTEDGEQVITIEVRGDIQ
jgi:hypothetical protein